jgi:double-strand break repair protein MRE11
MLIATDNHVGAHERDPIRGNDSVDTFEEIMCLAREKEVDMVLLSGDLFHENKPSRKSMYHVMRALRQNCLGARPCELEMLSDGSEHFDSYFDHANYEDPDINISIPVFSIHGNHDDPSGEGHFTALDLLSMSGLINYFGRTPQNDNIEVKPVLMQKGTTKLALYGLSNVRDERLYRTFRDEKVRFFRPSTQQIDWFQMMCVHQNHVPHTETSYLPENFLPTFLDLVIWGHEHECKIEPEMNVEMNFKVMQPGSSVATSLMPGEAVPKYVTVLSITGKEFISEPIRLRTVRPFIYRDIVLSSDKAAIKIGTKDDHRTELTRYLIGIVDSMIDEAEKQWEEARAENPPPATQESSNASSECPLPLIRLRVDTMKPDGISKFEVENPQRFSNRFTGRVANTKDIISFTARKKAASGTRIKGDLEAEKEIMARLNSGDIQVSKLVREFLEAQSLTILPQNYFGDAVNQFVDKDDRHAMEMFVNDSLSNQIKTLVKMQEDGDAADAEADEELMTQIQEIREGIERDFSEGLVKARKATRKLKPRPKNWDSDEEGPWVDNPAALIRSEDEDEGSDDDATPAPSTRGRGRGKATTGRGRGSASTRARGGVRGAKTTAARGKKTAISDDDDEDEDVVMLDDDDDQSQASSMFFKDKAKSTASSSRSKAIGTSRSTAGRAAASRTKKPPARAAAAKQSTLNFTTSQQSVMGSRRGRSASVASESIEDDEDDFEPVSQAVKKGRR